MKSIVRSFRRLWPLTVLVAFAGCYHPPPEPGLRMHAVKLPLDAYRLPSGMQIIIEEDHSSPIVGVVAVISAGNADDPVGKEGLAHLVEHLTFRARPDGKTQRRNLLDYAAAGDVNAITEPDDTVYWEFGPARSLEGLIRIEANRLAAPLPGLDEATFDVERGVVQNELVQSDRTHLPLEVEGVLFPAELGGGAASTRVCIGERSGESVYVGITNNIARRQAQHGVRFV